MINKDLIIVVGCMTLGI